MRRVWIAYAATLSVTAAVSVLSIGAETAIAAEVAAAPPPAVPIETVKTYDVRGTTLDQLRGEVFSRGPMDRVKGQRFAGWTDWEIMWRPDYEQTAHDCRVRKITTETHVTYTLPRWVDEAKAPPPLATAWNLFASSLTEHELGHGRLALELSQRMEYAMAAIPPQPSCAELEQKINALGTHMIDADDTQEAYDRRTSHGASQGALFPRVLARGAGTTPPRTVVTE